MGAFLLIISIMSLFHKNTNTNTFKANFSLLLMKFRVFLLCFTELTGTPCHAVGQPPGSSQQHFMMSQMECVPPTFLLELKAFSAASQACFHLLHVIKSQSFHSDIIICCHGDFYYKNEWLRCGRRQVFLNFVKLMPKGRVSVITQQMCDLLVYFKTMRRSRHQRQKRHV